MAILCLVTLVAPPVKHYIKWHGIAVSTWAWGPEGVRIKALLLRQLVRPPAADAVEKTLLLRPFSSLYMSMDAAAQKLRMYDNSLLLITPSFNE